MSARLSLVFLLAACDAPCLADTDVCDGLYRYGQLGLESNRSSVDGDYAPKLAGCRRLILNEDNELVEEGSWDSNGRLVSQVLYGTAGSGSVITRDLAWDGPCMTSRIEDIVPAGAQAGDCTIASSFTCDADGWPIVEQRSVNDSEPTVWEFDNVYSDGRLAESAMVRNGAVVSTTEHTWVLGRATRTRVLGSDDDEQWEIRRQWSDDRMTASTSTASGAPTDTVWTYDDADRMLQDGQRTWHYARGAHLPSQLTEAGRKWIIVEECP